MEVFAQFFRRTVVLNSAAIFSNAKEFDQGSYKLLRQELEKVLWDYEQSYKIAEAIDTSKEDLFRDFDLVTFIQHFFNDTLPQVILAIAFTRCGRIDLRAKADAFLNDFAASSLRSLADTRGDSQAFSIECICSVIEYYALAPGIKTKQQKIDLWTALSARYAGLKPEQFTPALTSSQLLRLTSEARELARGLQRSGPKPIASKQAAQDFVATFDANALNESEVATAILFLIFSFNQQYDINHLVHALQGKKLDWNLVVQGFDIPGLRLRRDYFSRLLNALRELAVENSSFDLQKLWGGQWQNPDTQISFLGGYLAGSPKDIQFAKIPHLRFSLSIEDFSNQSAEMKQLLEAELASPYVSADACQAVFEIVLGPNASPDGEDRLDILHDVYQSHAAVFLLYLSRINAKPWAADQEKFIAECFSVFLEKQRPGYQPVLETLSSQNPQFLFDLCHLVFQLDPRQTETVYDRAEEFGWTESFLKHWSNPLALDIACIRNKTVPDFDLDKYISEAAEAQPNLGMILCKYLRIKADDEFRVQRGETAPQSTPLSLRTVHTLLEKLEDYLDNRELLEAAQTTCLQTYPRLMNYGAGFDDVLEKSSEEKGTSFLKPPTSRCRNYSAGCIDPNCPYVIWSMKCDDSRLLEIPTNKTYFAASFTASLMNMSAIMSIPKMHLRRLHFCSVASSSTSCFLLFLGNLALPSFYELSAIMKANLSCIDLVSRRYCRLAISFPSGQVSAVCCYKSLHFNIQKSCSELKKASEQNKRAAMVWARMELANHLPLMEKSLPRSIQGEGFGDCEQIYRHVVQTSEILIKKSKRKFSL